MKEFLVFLFVLKLILCDGFTLIERTSFEIIKFGPSSNNYFINLSSLDVWPYQVDFNKEDVLCYIICKATLTDPMAMEVEQFGYSSFDPNYTSTSTLAMEKYLAWDDADSIKITCTRHNKMENAEIISLQLFVDQHEKGKTTIIIEDSINLTEGNGMPLHCTGSGIIFDDMRKPQMIINTEKIMMAENITMEQGDSMLRCSEADSQDNSTEKFMIIVYRN